MTLLVTNAKQNDVQRNAIEARSHSVIIHCYSDNVIISYTHRVMFSAEIEKKNNDENELTHNYGTNDKLMNVNTPSVFDVSSSDI